MNKRLKNIILAVITLIIVVVAVEILSFLFFNIFKDRFTFFDVDQYLLNDAVIKYAHQKYNPERGWDTKYHTRFGERPRQVSYKKDYIATFGDSYTHCDQVEHHETWQEYLSSMLQRDVYNFGTGGYGTDQAYLKFLEKYPKVKTNIVILGLITENINRIVNVYRPFYNPRTGQRLTKPRFIIQGNKLVLLKNPVANEKEIEKLNSPEFIIDIGRSDFWYNRNNYPVLTFPYSKILLNKHLWLELTYKQKGYQIDDINPRPWVNLWEDKYASDIMFKILESFVAKARQDNAVPLIMVIPMTLEVAIKLKTGKDTENTSKISEFCKLHKYHYFNPMDGFVEYVKKGNALSGLYNKNEHVSPQGNLIIANQLLQYLSENIASE
jgi:hypothetical protein